VSASRRILSGKSYALLPDAVNNHTLTVSLASLSRQYKPESPWKHEASYSSWRALFHERERAVPRSPKALGRTVGE